MMKIVKVEPKYRSYWMKNQGLLWLNSTRYSDKSQKIGGHEYVNFATLERIVSSWGMS